MFKAKVPVIVGPTAVGKSEYAFNLARKFNFEIVNLDPVQAWEYADIGSAKPEKEFLAGVNHHLISIFPLDYEITAGAFTRLVEKTVLDLRKVGKEVVLVGASGMYISSIFSGLDPLPTKNPGLREEFSTLSTKALYDKLLELDVSRAAKLHPHDRVRIERACEILLSAKEVEAPSEPLLEGEFTLLLRERSSLYARIDARVDVMLERGLLNEARQIYNKYGEDIGLFRTIGYRHALEMLKSGISGDLMSEDLVRQLKRDTRHLAKRQLTYWRNEPMKRGWKISTIPL
jgi:tRNA dimethylallyltransferase